MSDIAAILARTKAQMDLVPRIGNVYKTRQLVWDQNGIAAVASYEDPVLSETVLRFWTMRTTIPDTKWEDSAGRKQWWRQVLIEGRLQWDNEGESELLGQQLAEAVILQLANDVQATKLGGTIIDGKVPKLLSNEPQIFAGFLVCQTIAIDFRVWTIEA